MKRKSKKVPSSFSQWLEMRIKERGPLDMGLRDEDWVLREHLEWMCALNREGNFMFDPAKYAYACIEEFVLRHGNSFAPHPLTREVAQHLRRPKECFGNSYLLARGSGGDLRYVEGYALGQFPMPHAWCIDSENRVVDVTWATTLGVGVAYFGVVFDICRTRTRPPFIFDDFRGYSALKRNSRLPRLDVRLAQAGDAAA